MKKTNFLLLCALFFSVFANANPKIIFTTNTNGIASFRIDAVEKPSVPAQSKGFKAPFVSYVWDFGDGTVLMTEEPLAAAQQNAKTVEHTYAKNGVYKVNCYLNYHYCTVTSESKTCPPTITITVKGIRSLTPYEPVTTKRDTIITHGRQDAVANCPLPVQVRYYLPPTEQDAVMYVFVETHKGQPLLDLMNKKTAFYPDIQQPIVYMEGLHTKKGNKAWNKVVLNNFYSNKAYRINLSNTNRNGTDFHHILLPFMVDSRGNGGKADDKIRISVLVLNKDRKVISSVPMKTVSFRQAQDPNLLLVSPTEITGVLPHKQPQRFTVHFENKGTAGVENVYITLKMPLYTDTTSFEWALPKKGARTASLENTTRYFEYHNDTAILHITIKNLQLQGTREKGALRKSCQGVVQFWVRSLPQPQHDEFVTRALIRFDSNDVIKTPRVQLGLESKRPTLALRTIATAGGTITTGARNAFWEYGADISFVERIASSRPYSDYGIGFRQRYDSQFRQADSTYRQVINGAAYIPTIYATNTQTLHLFYEQHFWETSWLELATGVAFDLNIYEEGSITYLQEYDPKTMQYTATNTTYKNTAWKTIQRAAATKRTLRLDQFGQTSAYISLATSLPTRRSHVRLGINAGVRTQSPDLIATTSLQSAAFGSLFLKYRFAR